MNLQLLFSSPTSCARFFRAGVNTCIFVVFSAIVLLFSSQPVFAAPITRTDPATAIYDDRAVLNGYIDPQHESDIYHWFEWGLSSSLGNETPRRWHGINPTSYGWFIQNLLPQRTYYFRSVAQYSSGTIRGEIRTFTTLPGPQGSGPEVRTESATAVTLTSAGLRGYVDPQGRSGVTRWFEWGGTSALGVSTGSENHGSSASSYTAFISGLQPGTTYYYRAMAEQAGQRVVGGTLSFRTLGTVPVTPTPQPSPVPQPTPSPTPNTGSSTAFPIVGTRLATGIGDTSTLLNGSVSSTGFAAMESWFEWGTTSALGRITEHRNLGFVQTTEFSAALSGLAPDTVYYFRAAAENPAGRAFGSVFSFRTSPPQFSRSVAAVGAALPQARSTAAVTGRRSVLLAKRVENETLPSCEIAHCIAAVSGHKVRYTLTAENNGTVRLRDVVITDVLSDYLEFVGASSNGTYHAEHHEIRWDLGDLEPDALRTVTVEVRAGSVSAYATVVNIATVAADGVTKSSNETEIRIYPEADAVSAGSEGTIPSADSTTSAPLPAVGAVLPASTGSSVTGWAIIGALVLLATWTGFQIRKQIRRKGLSRMSTGVTDITNERF